MFSVWLHNTVEEHHKWAKKSSPLFEVAGEYFEYHWYEHTGIGRFETKQVQVKRL
jgi:hypothetical protein